MNSFIATSALLVIHLAIFAVGDEARICRLTDEDLEDCLEEKAVRLGQVWVNTADPLEIDLLKVNHTLVQGELKNVHITGLKNVKLVELRVDGSSMTLVTLNTLTMRSDLSSTVGPLDITGTVFAILGNVRYTMTSRLKEDASQTLVFDDVEANITVETMNVIIKLPEGTDSVIQETVDKFVKAKGKEMFQSVTTDLEPLTTRLVTDALLQLNTQ